MSPEKKLLLWLFVWWGMEEAVTFTEPAGSYGEAEAGGQMSRGGGDPDVLGSVQGVRT